MHCLSLEENGVSDQQVEKVVFPLSLRLSDTRILNGGADVEGISKE